MSKTFKNATNEGTEVYVGEGINADSVQLIIRNVGSDIGKAGIYLNSSDIPALALAILEAAGYTEDDTEVSPRKNLVATDYSLGMRYLRFGIEDQEHKAQAKKTAEAEAQAKLEAEALELCNAAIRQGDGAIYDSFSQVPTPDMWLAVARRAREINKEENND